MTTISKAELEPILKEMAVERDYQEDLKGLTAEPWRPPPSPPQGKFSVLLHKTTV